MNNSDNISMHDLPADYVPPENAKDLIFRYKHGERYFCDAFLLSARLDGAILRKVNLKDVDLEGATLEGAILEGADLSGANLDTANLELANLEHANLEHANLKSANLGDANLSAANLACVNLIGANLTDANFSGADLSGAKLTGANLEGTNFQGANLTGANLPGANLAGENLEGANLNRAEFEGANLAGVNLVTATLEATNLGGANLMQANLTGSNLEGANLAEANLVKANLEETNLGGANLGRANLAGANLAGANLAGADCHQVELVGVDFRVVSIAGAVLEGADLTDIGVDQRLDLLMANWNTLTIGDKTFHREMVEKGVEILPFGNGKLFAVVIESARLSGMKHDAVMTVLDHLANNGVEAKMEQHGSAGSTIRLSVKAHENADMLLQVGDGVCRLLGLGSGIENLLPSGKRMVTKNDFEEGLTLMASKQDEFFSQILNALDEIGKEDVKSVKLSGFTDQQMKRLRSVVDEIGDLLEIKFLDGQREAIMTIPQKLGRDVYEMKVPKPLRTLLGAVFSSSSPE